MQTIAQTTKSYGLTALLALAPWLDASAADAGWQWRQDDGSLALLNGTNTVWQLNFKKGEGKPYFHPLNLADGTTLTAVRPADHPWHLGLWWSWKYINHTNYWEENRKTGLSDGRTELVGVKTEALPNHTAHVEMQLTYHLPDQPPVLNEKRLLDVSAPDAQEGYYIDWTTTFTPAGTEDVVFERTPPKNYSGGYAGLSCRFAKLGPAWSYTGSSGLTTATNLYGKQEAWIDFSNGGGIAIFDHPANLRHPSPWYPNDKLPFFSPALLFHEPYILKAGKSLTLRYRVFIHTMRADRMALDAAWKAFAGATR